MLPSVVRLPMVLVASTFIAACGPETNSRYGDTYWDPWDTKQTYDSVVTPEFEIQFYDISGEDNDLPIYEARISLDASETNKRLIAYSWSFVRGTREYNSLDLLGASIDYLTYLQNPDDPSEDNRLIATVAGDYRIVFTGDLIGPLGKTTLTFDDMAFTLPGCPSTFSYYADYIDTTLQSCASCHSAGEAGAAFSIPNNNFNNRRQNFLNYVNSDIDSEEPMMLPAWVVHPEHLGSTTIDEFSAEYGYLSDFIKILEVIKIDNEGAALATANNSGGDSFPTDFCIATPDGFEVVEES